MGPALRRVAQAVEKMRDFATTQLMRSESSGNGFDGFDIPDCN